jgi:hypothetical protein
VELYSHFFIHLQGTVLSYFSRRTILPLLIKLPSEKQCSPSIKGFKLKAAFRTAYFHRTPQSLKEAAETFKSQ